jgi:hypothetical protein
MRRGSLGQSWPDEVCVTLTHLKVEASRSALGASLPQRRIIILRFGFRRRDRLFEILQSQGELIGIQLFRALVELHALEHGQAVSLGSMTTSTRGR